MDIEQTIFFIEPNDKIWNPLIPSDSTWIDSHPIRRQIWILTGSTYNNVKFKLTPFPKTFERFNSVTPNNSLKNLEISFDRTTYYLSGTDSTNNIQYVTSYSQTHLFIFIIVKIKINTNQYIYNI